MKILCVLCLILIEILVIGPLSKYQDRMSAQMKNAVLNYSDQSEYSMIMKHFKVFRW
jgi:hypothetical protein